MIQKVTHDVSSKVLKTFLRAPMGPVGAGAYSLNVANLK